MKTVDKARNNMKYTDKNIHDFVNSILQENCSRGIFKCLDKLDDIIVFDMKTKGIELYNLDVVIKDEIILKYRNHPKAKKSATIDFNRFDELEMAIKKPLHIYEDLKSEYLVYVYTNIYDENKLLKVIVQPNYKLKKNQYINLVKSIGVVDKQQIENAKQQYRKIK